MEQTKHITKGVLSRHEIIKCWVTTISKSRYKELKEREKIEKEIFKNVAGNTIFGIFAHCFAHRFVSFKSHCDGRLHHHLAEGHFQWIGLKFLWNVSYRRALRLDLYPKSLTGGDGHSALGLQTAHAKCCDCQYGVLLKGTRDSAISPDLSINWKYWAMIGVDLLLFLAASA